MSGALMTKAERPWKPAPSGGLWSLFGHFCTFWTYPALLSYLLFDHHAPSLERRHVWAFFASLGVAGAVIGHHAIGWRWGRPSLSNWTPGVAHLMMFLCWDHAYFWLTYAAKLLPRILEVDRKTSRLAAGRLHGSRVIIVGNGPSALEGEELGHKIDAFDEVVRFNNFQTKTGALHKFVGSKTTVHFSDGVLYPTYTEYHVPGATVVLSLFADTEIIAGSYILQRAGQDMQWPLTERFLLDPEITWIAKEDIERVKAAAGLKGIKHPTSGLLAIDFFVNSPGVQHPVYIHGFDFFMGPRIHYFHEHEPLWERVNNNIGVNMHSPHLEKLYVQKLIDEGKVRFLKDMPR